MSELREPEVRVPVTLLMRICNTFLEMQQQGATTQDLNLFEDLDKVLASHGASYEALDELRRRRTR